MPCEIFWIGPVFAGRLAVMTRPRGGDWLEDEVDGLVREGVDVVACLLTKDELRDMQLEQEEFVCTSRGIEFVHFPVRDHSVPEPGRRSTGFIRSIAEHLRLGKAVAAHCWMGIGRSVLTAASVMALAGVPPEEAFARIGRARGLDVPDTEEQREWVQRFARENAPER